MIKSRHSLATQRHRSTPTIDRDVELFAPVISGDVSSSIAISLPSVVSTSSADQASASLCLLPRWNECSVYDGVGSLGSPPHSNSTIAVSSQDLSSLQLTGGGFLFGLSAPLSKPFKLSVSSSSLGAIPFCSGYTSTECNPPLATSAYVNVSSSSGDVPATYSDTSGYDETATSSNVQSFRRLPLYNVELPCDATVTASSTVSETLPALHSWSRITSNVGATPLLETPSHVTNTSKLQSCTTRDESALYSGLHFSQPKPLFHTVSTSQHGEFLSKSDVEVSKQMSLSYVLTSTPVSSTYTAQASSSATTPTLLPHTQSQSIASSSHLMLSSSSSTIELPRIPLNDAKIVREAVTEDSSSCRENSPQFEPLVSLPLIEELSSGEEGEVVLFSHRAKLYQFDDSQWKERGVGNMKILRHKISGKARLLMRRDQVLKLCCNHFISSNMSITEMKGSSELAWCTNCDFSDGVSKPVKFAIKFKHRETGSVFKQIFEECALRNNISDNTSSELSIPGSLVSISQTSTSLDETAMLSQKKGSSFDSLLVSTKTSSDDTCSIWSEASGGSTKPISEDLLAHTPPTDSEPEIILTKVEMPSNNKLELSRQLMLPDTFFNYENKPSCPGCRGCIDQYSASQDEEHELPIKYTSDQNTRDVFSSTSKCPVPGFAELAASEPSAGPFSRVSHSSSLHAFEGAGEALFKQHVEGMDDLGDDVQFKAVVSLPEVDVKTGEENEEVLFNHKAKLFRFDSNISQWKERGVGDMKLLRNVSTNKVRILMRRDQIFKVCCNHFITSDMSLLAYKERSWMWFTLDDFADEVPRPEKFAVKFKSVEIAQLFKVIFENCVSRCKSGISERNGEATKTVDTNTGDDLKERFAPKRGSWICNVCYVCNPESVTLCLACQSPQTGLNTNLLSPQNSAGLLKKLHICSPSEVTAAGNHNTRGFQLPLNITLPTCSSSSVPVTKSATTTVSLSPRLTSPDLHVLDSLMSASEKEEVTFSANGILYMEDLQWDKGSYGEMKIIKNKLSGEKRLLMISKDRKSALCSHGVTSMMHLKPHPEKERSWIWNGFDNRRSTPTKSAIQQYCIEFHLKDDALMFKNNFGTSFSVSTDTRQPPYIADDEVSGENCCSVEVTLGNNQECESDDDVIFVCEECPSPSQIKKAEELLLPKSFYLYEKKPSCIGCRGCDDAVQNTSQIIAKPTTFTEPGSLSNCKDEISTAVRFSSAGLLSFTDLISKEDSSMCSFPNVNRLHFDGAGKQLFAPNLRGDHDPEAETDIDFLPLVSLPETYHVKSWDQGAKILFLQRAKLYRFDKSVNQWRERGIGDMKILQHHESNKVCLIMRRDQILKLCCNHYLTESMQLIQLETERSWMWFTPSDFSGDKPQPEKLAVRFKSAERGLEFKKVFDECVAQQKLSAKQICPPPSKKDPVINISDVESWECPQCLIWNRNKDCKCAACGYVHPVSHLDATTINFGNTGGVMISSNASAPAVSDIEPYPLSAGSGIEGNSLLQEVPLSTSTSLIAVQTSWPLDSTTPIAAAATIHQPLVSKDDNSAPGQSGSDTA